MKLRDPLHLPCGAVLPNRLAKAAMTERLADPLSRATVEHATLYNRLAQGGAGLLITGNVVVDRQHLERARNISVDQNGGLDALGAMATAGKSGGNHIWMQINHPGRQSGEIVNSAPVAPSAVPVTVPGFAPPRELSHEEIIDIIARFAKVAGVARDVGFTGVQLHGAHGYLISQFLSNRTNLRTDEWGGSLQSRARFVLEIVSAVRKEVGSGFPISVKLNSTDFEKGGYEPDDAAWVAQALENAGIDLLEISGGTYERQEMGGSETAHADATKKASTIAREAYFIEYAEIIRQKTKLPLMVTGGFRTAAAMEDALASGVVDAIGVGRPICVDPDSPGKLLAGETDSLPCAERTLQIDMSALGPDRSEETLRQAQGGYADWYGIQLQRMGAGLEPDLSMAVHLAGLKGYAEEVAAAAALDR